MDKPKFFVFLCLILVIAVHAVRRTHGSESVSNSMKLFVFGDSYADTGNWPKSFASSWKEPYGLTFPGKPSGRFSDGRVLTDYIAAFVGIRSPIPYERRKFGKNLLHYGMNFAYGGTGVFNTLANEPNMSTQINMFQQLLEEKVYTKLDLNSSIALVSLGGNDYATYMALNGSIQGFPAFTKLVINQLIVNVKRIHRMGIRKIGVTAMEPLGCLPQFTAFTSYQNCSTSENSVSKFHNQMLELSLRKMNNESHETAFIIVDLYNAFMSVLGKQENSGSKITKYSLKPCCVGINKGDSCGSVDQNLRAKKYTVCKNPELSFFWDVIHPSQQGWRAISSALRSSLHQLL